MNIGSAFIANLQAAKAIELGQLLAAFNPAASDARQNVTLPKNLAVLQAVVALVRIQLGGSPPRPSPFLANGWDRIHHLLQQSGFIDVGSGVPDHQRNPLPFDHKMALLGLGLRRAREVRSQSIVRH